MQRRVNIFKEEFVMGKEEIKKLTLKDLIAKKVIKDKQKNLKEDIYVESLEGEITFEKPQEEDVLAAMDKISGDTSVQENADAIVSFIYKSCPMLRNKELQDAYGVKDPKDIVKELFTLSERDEIGQKLLKMSGIKMKEVAEKVKN